MMHAQIIDGTIANLRPTPAGGAWEDDQWLDFSDPATLAAWEERHGYTLVVETPQPQDTDTVKHDESVVLVDGVPTQTWTAYPWNAAELAERDRATTVTKLAADTTADKAKIEQAIANLLVLLGDDTQAGSIRAIVGPKTATAGTTSLRALRQQSNTTVVSAASIKAFLGLTIDLAQRVIDDAQATRRVARQTLRLARLATGDYSSADVGADVGADV